MTPSAGTGARIGIFGGTFDPVHRGHLAVAAAVHRVLGLDRTLLMVANLPWQKAGLRSVTPAEDRYAMVAAAVEGRPGLEAGRQEIDRGGPSYTVDTADELLRLDPAAELFVVVGADVVPDLGTWHDHGRLRDLVTLAVVGRPGTGLPAVPDGWRSVTVDVPPFDVSSTDLRERLERGEPGDGDIPPAVIRCIRRRGLYATGR